MTEHRASSGVRNLRAMFESQSAASSPEPRGRSPSRRFNADPDRPTSKVKASFVSVDPNFQLPQGLGTTKGTVDGINSPDAQRRESFSVTKELGEEAVTELKKVVSAEKEAREKSDVVQEAIPEQAVESREASISPPPITQPENAMPNLGSIMKGSDFPEPRAAEEDKPAKEEAPAPAPAPAAAAEQATDADFNIEEKLAALSLKDMEADNPDKIVTGVQEDASLKPADPTDEAAISGGEALPAGTEVLPSANTAADTPKTPKRAENTPPKAGPNGTAKSTVKNGASAAKKPAAISTAKASTAKASTSKSPIPRSPGVARVPRTPTTPRNGASVPASKPSAPAKEESKPAARKEPTKAPVAKTSQSSLKSSTIGTTASAAAKAKAPEQKKAAAKTTSAAPAPKTTATSPTGFKKPRPKSPTRPVRLPSHLTAPTAAFAAKHGDEAVRKPAPKPAAAARPPVAKAAPPARKPSSRASMAPSIASEKRPSSRASTVGGASEGFLARMMRPTASSASKTHEKPASPPRRGASVRAPARPKAAQPGVVAKAKAKVGEVASKAKEAVDTVVNGSSEDHADEGQQTEEQHGQNSEPHATKGEPAEPAKDESQLDQAEREATPVEHVEPSMGDVQPSNPEGQEAH